VANKSHVAPGSLFGDGGGDASPANGYDLAVSDLQAGRPASERSTVVLYSHQASFRAQVLTAVGRRPAPDAPRIDWLECSTSAQVIEQIDIGEIDLVILDGESQPTGGMGLARQFKYEIDDCPPILVVVARKDDGWLASWSLADAVISQPLDPVQAAAAVAEQLRARRAGLPVIR
jgi:DNA-binding NarL/FixJ family response regulator